MDKRGGAPGIAECAGCGIGCSYFWERRKWWVRGTMAGERVRRGREMWGREQHVVVAFNLSPPTVTVTAAAQPSNCPAPTGLLWSSLTSVSFCISNLVFSLSCLFSLFHFLK